MNKKQVFVLLSVSLLALGFSIFQYVKEFQAEYADAYSSTKPANGHLWSEMECTSSLCITGGNIGIGTDSPSSKLSVVGNIGITGGVQASGDVCGGGICLSQVANYYSSNPLYTSTHTVANCSAAGGALIANPSGTGLPICKFTNSSGVACPTGWTQYSSPAWTVTAAHYCSGDYAIHDCTTGYHSTLSNTAIETCTYHPIQSCDNGCNESEYNAGYATCYAIVTQIGCY